ncbi:MAG: hypothetical protein CVT80_06130 [Alphaproteobacteria bacterium HGW-Alphaproteobacteria-2]|nr:MAG: hypothetical protein CVT80_06130 [Alphaproteobacteria bacterium HGW-Alphaproteobacteria-2]
MSMMGRTPPEPGHAVPVFWQTAAPGGRLDCETAALLRACVLRAFDVAESWAALIRQLEVKGLRLAFRDGRLMLLHAGSGAALCTDGFLGQRLPDLVARLGRPTVRMSHAASSSGEIRH